MRFVLVLIGTMVTLDLLWWAASRRIAKPIFARIAVAIFALAQLTGLIWLLAQRFARAESTALFSKFALTNVFIWHMFSCHCSCCWQLRFCRSSRCSLSSGALGASVIRLPRMRAE